MALLVGNLCLAQAPLPGWWSTLLKRPRLEARFVHRLESAVFGKITRQGKLWLDTGGRMRFAYDSGLLVICDGKLLVQYDPDTRTAQQMPLSLAQKEFPLLGLLVDPTGLGAHYRISNQPSGQLRLEPRTADRGPEILLSGEGTALRRILWKDATGGQQELELQAGKSGGGGVDPTLFRFKAPAGTRWVSP